MVYNHGLCGPVGVKAHPCLIACAHDVAAVDIGGRSEGSDYTVISVLDALGTEGTPEIAAQWRVQAFGRLCNESSYSRGRYTRSAHALHLT